MRRRFRPRFSKEYHQDLASHIESRQKRSGQQHKKETGVLNTGIGEDLVLREEPGQRWKSGLCPRTDEIHPERDLHTRT